MRGKGLIFAVLCVAGIGMIRPTQQMAQAPQRKIAAPVGTVASYGNLPLLFEANEGQLNSGIEFLTRGSGYTAFLTPAGMVLSFQTQNEGSVETSDNSQISAANTLHRPKSMERQYSAIAIDLVGGKHSPVIVGEQPLATKVNYFIGRDPSKWHRNVPTYKQVRYTDVYPGIDLVYYGKDHRLEYDFRVRPGADPSRIQFEIRGADSIDVDSSGSLILRKGKSKLLFEVPVVFQESSGGRKGVAGSYVKHDAIHVGFALAAHDKTKALVIDPVLVYSTLLGGSGDDFSSGIAVDATGEAYVLGLTDSLDFPLVTIGSYNPTQFRLFLAKLNANGNGLVFADYFGGTSGNDDVGAIALDSSGNAYVTGTAASTDFPVVNAYQSTLTGSADVFLSEFSSDGSSLLYSSYLGGSNSQTAYSVAVDPAGEAIVAGVTTSTDFPTVNAYQPSVSQDQFGDWGEYGFITKFTAPAGNSLVYSSYLGGSTLNATTCNWCFPKSELLGIATDVSGNAYVTGYTNTTNFPVTPGSLMSNFPYPNATETSFVSKLTSSGAIGYSTYFPGPLFGLLDGIAVDSDGAAYVTGGTSETNSFPVTNTAICNPSLESCSGSIVAKLDAAGANILYSTYLGSGDMTFAQVIQLDANRNAFVLGSADQFSLINPIEGYAGNGDVVLVELDPSASTLLMSTFLGGQGPESASGLALDTNGAVYVTGLTESLDFPITQSAFQASWGGNTDAFIAKIDPVTIAPAVTIGPWSLDLGFQFVGSTSASQTSILRNTGSAPLVITGRNTTGDAGDFAESDDCSATVAPASSCTLTFTFTPSASGARNASFTISDSAQDSPHTVALTGNGTDSNVNVSPSSLSFPDTTVGSSSSPQTVTLSNTGSVDVVVSGVQVTGDFAILSDTCTGNTVTPTGTCTVQVEFTPTTPDQLAGTLELHDSAASRPQSVSLSGTGQDFTTSVESNSAMIESGGAATYILEVRSAGTSFTKNVSFSCAGLPTFATCTIDPSSIVPDAPVKITVSTSSIVGVTSSLAGRRRLFIAWLCASFISFVLCIVPTDNCRRRWPAYVRTTVLSLLLLTGCSAVSPMAPSVSQTGTYNFSVASTSGILHKITNLTLIVR